MDKSDIPYFGSPHWTDVLSQQTFDSRQAIFFIGPKWLHDTVLHQCGFRFWRRWWQQRKAKNSLLFSFLLHRLN